MDPHQSEDSNLGLDQHGVSSSKEPEDYRLIPEDQQRPHPEADSEDHDVEAKILDLARRYKAEGKATSHLEQLIGEARQAVESLTQAKGDKLMKTLVTLYLELEEGSDSEGRIRICRDTILWATNNNRNYLRRSLQIKLVALYCELGQWNNSLKLGALILPELKKLDEREHLVEVQYLESWAYLALSNLPKARAALFAAKTTANSIYVTPSVQARLDFQSGVLCAAESKDFKTAFSYFFEAYEQYSSVQSPEASKALQYMILSKIMINQPDEVSKFHQQLVDQQNVGVVAMLAIARAAQDRSLSAYTAAVEKYGEYLTEDHVMAGHLRDMREDMLEKNLSRIVEPYSVVHLDYVAQKIGENRQRVERKLSRMILDSKIRGVIDQESGVLILHTDSSQECLVLYEDSLEVLTAANTMVDALCSAARRLNFVG